MRDRNDVASDDADFETVAGDPASYYADPQAIVADDSLSQAQKRRFLTEWAQDLIDRQASDNEGMAPAAGHAGHDDSALLRRVNDAIADVEIAGEREAGANGWRQWWRRLTSG